MNFRVPTKYQIIIVKKVEKFHLIRYTLNACLFKNGSYIKMKIIERRTNKQRDRC